MISDKGLLAVHYASTEQRPVATSNKWEGERPVGSGGISYGAKKRFNIFGCSGGVEEAPKHQKMGTPGAGNAGYTI